MRALLARLSEAENDVEGPPPWWVSFKWIATWCSNDGRPVVDDRRLKAAYRQLLDAFLAGSFRTSRVLYLGDPASARRSEPPALSNAGGIAGYRMTAQFLEARTKIYSPNDPAQSWILFNSYLAPCWIRRLAAARWLENNRYPLPAQWATAARGAAAPPAAQTANRVRRKSPIRDRVKNLMLADIRSGAATIEQLRSDKDAWAMHYRCSVTTAYEAAKELEAELKVEADAASRSQSPDQERLRATKKW
jgi:hypothetical protein